MHEELLVSIIAGLLLCSFCFKTFLYVLHTILVPVAVVGLYNKNTNRICKSKKTLFGKTVIVTGGTSGMGLHIALDLAQRGARVVIACPFLDEGLNAKKHIEKKSQSNKVVFKLLDLSSFQAVREFAADILKTEDRLDILVNNAGVGEPSVKVTADGLPTVMQVNYFGANLLTFLLLPLLKKTGTAAEHSRIVYTTSALRKFAKLNFDNWIDAKIGSAALYRNSKICLLYFSKVLSDRLRDENVVVHAVDPGGVGGTGIHKNLGLWGYVYTNLLTFLSCNTWEGSQTTLFVCLSDIAGQLRGKCFKNCRIFEQDSDVCDEKTALRLWNETLKLLELKGDDWNQLK